MSDKIKINMNWHVPGSAKKAGSVVRKVVEQRRVLPDNVRLGEQLGLYRGDATDMDNMAFCAAEGGIS